MHTIGYEPEDFDIEGRSNMTEAVIAQVAKINDDLVRDLLAGQGIEWNGTDIKQLKEVLDRNNYELVSTTEGDFLVGRTHTIKLVKVLGQRKFKFTTKVDTGG